MCTYKILTGPFIDGIKKSVEKQLRKDKNDSKRTIIVFTGKREELLAAEFDKIENVEKLGRFTNVINNGIEEKTTSSFFGSVAHVRRACERYYKPTGEKKISMQQTNPEKLSRVTRANGCPAYVSHMFFKFNSYDVCVQRVFAQHDGHDINNPEENRVSKISPVLKEKIMRWFRYKISKAEILRLCRCWAKDNGHLDPLDGCYYPSARNIANLFQSYRNNVFKSISSDVVDKICTETFKEHVVYFQRFDEKSKTPLIILLQTDWQFDRMKKFGNHVVFLDANFSGIITNGYAVYALLVLDDSAKAVPVCFALVSAENEENVLYNWLNELNVAMQTKGFYWRPLAFVLNKDVKAIDAVRKLFEYPVPVLMCWSHVLETILEWSTRKDSAVFANKTLLSELLEAMVVLKNSATENDFFHKWRQMTSNLPGKIITYMNDNWISRWKMWANYGRQILQCYPKTNSAIETIFATKTNQLLHGLVVIPLDEMLKFLLVDLFDRYNDFDRTVESYRLKLSDCTAERARQMFAEGFGSKIIFKEDGQQLVPSESLTDVAYTACVDESLCSCPLLDYGVKCKHLWLIELFCEENGNLIDIVREENSSMLMQTGNYQRLDNYLLIPNVHNEFTSVVNIETSCCNCIAASFGSHCTCLKLLSKLQSSASEQFETVAEVYYEDSNDGEFSPDYPSTSQSLDAKEMCEDIIAKLNSGWTPSEMFIKNLRSLHSTAMKAASTTSSPKRKAQPSRWSPRKSRRRGER